MKLAVVGTGYVGLVTGTCFAETGNNVVCIDIDEAKINKIKSGEVPIYEPGLKRLLDRNIKQNRLHFTTDLEEGILNADIIFLALPTPPGEDGSADLSYVLGVAENLSNIITDYKVIVDKSTVPVGTAERVTEVLSKNLDPALFDVVSNPEFLREGMAIEDFMKPDRVIIGSSSDKAKETMRQLYKPFVRNGNPIYFMDERSAELTKYAANSFLATKISFINEIANLCELLDADVDSVRIGLGSDSRIGKKFLFPGVGYGGSCFPKDVLALSKMAEEQQYQFSLLQATMKVNDHQKGILSKKIKSYFGAEIKGKNIAVWGLSFKPETDDIREAPSIPIIQDLLNSGANIIAFDPEAMDNVRHTFGDRINYASSQYDAVKDADALAIITEWSAFRTPDFQKLKSLMNDKVIFDGRNIYDLKRMNDLGFYYDSIGRKLVDGRKK